MFLQGVSCFALVMSPAPAVRKQVQILASNERCQGKVTPPPYKALLTLCIREMEQKWNSFIAEMQGEKKSSSVLSVKYSNMGQYGAALLEFVDCTF